MRPVAVIVALLAADALLAVIVAKLMAGKVPGLDRYRPTPPPSKGEPCACR